MNRHAVILAADSATTVSRWVEGRQENRYFKGANKIFQLSHHQPVGVMIFNSADLMRVPWELLIKSFRDDLERKSFNSVRDYANEFIAWLDGNARFFPEDVQKETFVDASSSAAIGIILDCERAAGDDPDQRAKFLADYLPRRLIELEGSALPNGIDDDKIQTVRATWRDDVEAEIRDISKEIPWNVADSLDLLVEVSIREVFVQPAVHLSTAGLVFAGYGDHDVFPSMVEYQNASMIAGTPMISEVRAHKIDHGQPASLAAFAQTSMADTFQLGFSEDIYKSFMEALRSAAADFAKEICEKVEGDHDKLDDLEARALALGRKISDAVFDRARREHSFPLKQVVAVLPVDEMAELAETLVNLQSLKEKVTKPSASVGGPVDVAIITRHEGLVWVKRKKFFETDLNPRYMLRQQALHN
ncbi:hypothetical protein LJR090_001797 [Bosea sp. LjRoot90]|uniref:hypothetical protein n=1 Tax=Bosea sp. LjRoot90 TaxID=3342342 RepID=UPI003ED084FC